MPRLRILALALVLCLPLGLPATGAEVATAGEAWEISGSVLLNDSYPPAREAASCPTCHWRIVRACNWHAEGDTVVCETPHWPCATGTVQAEVWRADGNVRPPTDDPSWRYTGYVCLGDRPPLPADAVHAELHERVRLGVPPLDLGCAPRPTTLSGLRTYFWTKQPQSFTPDPVTVAGTRVTLRASPTWTWDFGDGPLFIAREPGAEYPKGRITHTYKRRGLYLVRLTARWDATFDAEGITDIPVQGGPVVQSRTTQLRVAEAAAFLTRKPR